MSELPGCQFAACDKPAKIRVFYVDRVDKDPLELYCIPHAQQVYNEDAKKGHTEREIWKLAGL